MKILFLILNIFLLLSEVIVAKDIRIAARVNNEIITTIDLENRLLMAMELSNIPNEEGIKKRLEEQVLKVLIEERLKIQEATKFGIFITSEELQIAIKRLENRLGIEENTLLKKYANKSIPEITIYNQIRAQLLWEKILNILVIKTIKVSDEQTSEAFNLFLKNSGETEYNFSEIFISFSNSNGKYTAKDRINSIYAETNIKNFLLLAQQFSDGAVVSENNANWTRESMISDDFKKHITKLQIGSIGKPVESSVGYHIFLLNDKRTTKKITENEILYDLSQIFFKLSENNKNEQIEYYKSFLNDLREIVSGCKDLDKMIEELEEGYGGRFGILNQKSIDKKFLNVLNNLSVGKLSKEIISQDGIHSLMLCRPIQKDTYNNIKENIEARIRMNKINNAGTSLLNRIKQKSLIEIQGL